MRRRYYRAFNLKQMKAHDCWLKIVPWQVNGWTSRLNKERGNDSFESFHLRDFALQSLVRVSSVFSQDGSTIVSAVPTEALHIVAVREIRRFFRIVVGTRFFHWMHEFAESKTRPKRGELSLLYSISTPYNINCLGQMPFFSDWSHPLPSSIYH